MELNLEPETKRRLAERARAAGLGSPEEYLRALVEQDLAREHAAWQQELARRFGLSPEEMPELRAQLAEGARRWAERDQEIAEEWLSLEEDLYDREPPRVSDDHVPPPR